MNWWDIVKTKLPDDHDERVAREETERLYGFSPPYLLGSLKALNDLRGDYYNIQGLKGSLQDYKKDLKIILNIFDRQKYFDNKAYIIYSINFQLTTDEAKSGTLTYPLIYGKSEDEIINYFKDWVEIYKQPNHTYKNIEARAQLSPRSKEILDKYKPVNDIEHILMRKPKIVDGTIEDDIWEHEVGGKTTYMTEEDVERAAIIQLAGEIN